LIDIQDSRDWRGVVATESEAKAVAASVGAAEPGIAAFVYSARWTMDLETGSAAGSANHRLAKVLESVKDAGAPDQSIQT